MVPSPSHLKSLECELCQLDKHVRSTLPCKGHQLKNSPFNLVHFSVCFRDQVLCHFHWWFFKLHAGFPNEALNSTPQSQLIRWNVPILHKLFSSLISSRCGTWIFPNTSHHAQYYKDWCMDNMVDGPIDLRLAFIPLKNLGSCLTQLQKPANWVRVASTYN